MGTASYITRSNLSPPQVVSLWQTRGRIDTKLARVLTTGVARTRTLRAIGRHDDSIELTLRLLLSLL